MEKNRTGYIDIAKGIGILLMVAGHVFYYGIYKKIIYSFHMPLFLIISGMFFKYNDNFKEFFNKIIKRLLIPYVVGVTVVSLGRNIIKHESIQILPQIICGFSNFKSIFLNVETVGALWFIPYIAFIQVLYNYLVKNLENHDISIGVECIIIMLIGFYFSKNMVYLPWSIDIAISTLILFYIGNMMFKYQLIDKIIKENKMILLLLAIWIIGFFYVELEFAKRIYSIISFIVAICGSMIILKVSYIIDRYFNLIGCFLKWCGKNSIYILIAHYFEYKIFTYTGENLEIFAKKLLFIIVITFCITVLKSIIEIIIKKRKIIKSEGI